MLNLLFCYCYFIGYFEVIVCRALPGEGVCFFPGHRDAGAALFIMNVTCDSRSVPFCLEEMLLVVLLR